MATTLFINRLTGSDTLGRAINMVLDKGLCHTQSRNDDNIGDCNTQAISWETLNQDLTFWQKHKTSVISAIVLGVLAAITIWILSQSNLPEFTKVMAYQATGLSALSVDMAVVHWANPARLRHVIADKIHARSNKIIADMQGKL